MAGQIIAGGRYVQFVTMTNGTSPTTGATVVASFADQVSTDIAIDGAGQWTMTIDHIQDDEAYNTFIETYRDFAIANVESITYEDGTIQSATSNKTLFAIVKGGNVAGGASAGKNKVLRVPVRTDLVERRLEARGRKVQPSEAHVRGRGFARYGHHPSGAAYGRVVATSPAADADAHPRSTAACTSCNPKAAVTSGRSFFTHRA
jgi:hypothetical protein